jgi:hypothetical protein
MPYVDETYYTNTYCGMTVPNWSRYDLRAEDFIDQITRYRIAAAGISSFPAAVQTLIQKAVCAQIEYYVENGIDVAQTGISASDYTIGKVHVGNGRTNNGESGKGTMASPAAIAYLEQTGLLNPQVPLASDVFVPFIDGGLT